MHARYENDNHARAATRCDGPELSKTVVFVASTLTFQELSRFQTAISAASCRNIAITYILVKVVLFIIATIHRFIVIKVDDTQSHKT